MDFNKKRKLKYLFIFLIFIILTTLLSGLISCSKIKNIGLPMSSIKTKNILTSSKIGEATGAAIFQNNAYSLSHYGGFLSYSHSNNLSCFKGPISTEQQNALNEKEILQESLEGIMDSIDEACREYENTGTSSGSIEEDTKGKDAPGENNTDKEEQGQQIQSSISLNDFTSSLLYLINNTRDQNGLAFLESNPTLAAVAKERSLDMLNRSYFSHTTPEGKNIFMILQESGIGYTSAGENIQESSPATNASAQLYFSTWMSSSLHRANILSADYSQIGIGVSFNDDRFVAVIVFLG